MLKDTVRTAMVTALKAGEKEKKGTLSMLLQSLEKAEKDKLAPLTEAEEFAVVTKMVKQLNESIDSCPASRTDLIEKFKNELSVVSVYMPVQMSADDIRIEVASAISGLGLESPSAKDKGAIMKLLMPKVKGKADGKLVNQIVMEFLK